MFKRFGAQIRIIFKTIRIIRCFDKKILTTYAHFFINLLRNSG